MTVTPRICQVQIDGHEVDEGFYRDIIAIEVSEHAREPSTFAISLALTMLPDGSYAHVDDDPAADATPAPWKRITISVGFGDNTEVLLDGYVGGLTPHFGRDDAESHLLLWGHDAAFAMDQEEKIVAWDDRKYSEVAAEIFRRNGLEADVVDTQVLHATRESLLVQRGTDWAFLKQLAERVGFEVYVRGGRGQFKPPELTATPQADLSGRFGTAATNLVWFRPEMTAAQPTQIAAARADVVSKKIQKVQIDESPQHPLGSTLADSFRSGRSAAGAPRMVVRHHASGSLQEMEALATGVRRRSDWAVSGEGEVDGRRYGRSLRARETVLIKGMGRTYSGAYYVDEVIHHLTRTEYRQRFKVQRNALAVVGNESFADLRDPEARPQPEPRERITTRRTGKVVAP